MLRGNHWSSGVCTRRQSENWCWPENDAMHDSATTAITLCRKQPDAVAMPVGKQRWSKHRVQCRRLSNAVARQDTVLYEGIKRQVMQHRSKHMCCRLSDAVAVPKGTQHMCRSRHKSRWRRLSDAVAVPNGIRHRNNHGCCVLSDAVAMPNDTPHMYRSNNTVWCRCEHGGTWRHSSARMRHKR